MNKPQFNIYKPAVTVIDRAETKRYAGLRQKQHFPEEIVEKACMHVLLAKQPETVWCTYPYAPDSGTVGEHGEYVITSKALCRHLQAAEQVILLAATVGEEVEVLGQQAFDRGEYALGLLIDAAATAAVEQTADELEKLLKIRFGREGFLLTSRFSPGYGDWELGEQAKVVPLTHAEAVNISLTESLMLMPRKSITAIIGLYRPTGSEKNKWAPGCAGCAKIDCEMRKDS